MATDVIINMANRTAYTLGLKLEERPTDVGREVVYSRSIPNWLSRFTEGIPQMFIQLFTTSFEDKLYMASIPHAVDSRLVLAIHDYACPMCGSPDEIRLLCGGGVDESNPHAPVLAFGNWDGSLVHNEHALKLADTLQGLVEKQRIRINMLAPLEKEVELYRSTVEEQKALLTQHELHISTMSSENNRLTAELGRILAYVEAKKLINATDAAEIKNALESVAFSKQMLENKQKLMEERLNLVKTANTEFEAQAKQLREAHIDADELRRKMELERRGTGLPPAVGDGRGHPYGTAYDPYRR